MIFSILRSKWKTVLLFLALIIAASSFWFTSELVSDLSVGERKKIKICRDWQRIFGLRILIPDVHPR